MTLKSHCAESSRCHVQHCVPANPIPKPRAPCVWEALAPISLRVFWLPQVAEAAARGAGELIAAGYGAEVKSTKASSRDLLTEVDGAAQQLIEAKVRNAFPSHRFLGEESVEAGQAASALALGEALEGGNEWVWVVDPIDGTTNFATGLPLSTVSIACVRDGDVVVGVVYDPSRDEMFSAITGGGATCNGEPMSCERCVTELGEAVVYAGSP